MATQIHFYDSQVRRYLLQFVRMFSGFTVKTGKTMNDGVTDYYIRVPARYGDASRMASSILKNNSENIVNSAPFIACYVQSLDLDRNRMQDPSFEDTVAVNERKYDETTKKYVEQKGNSYNVKRMMPVPYSLIMVVDIWTSNTDQKLQLFEQIGVLFNPSLDIQTINNPIDWSSITTVEMTNITWTSRAIPAGLEDQIDIMTLTFQVPIWINPPAIVTRQNLVRNVINNMYIENNIAGLDYSPDAFEFFNDISKDSCVVVTPNNYAVSVFEDNGVVFVKPLANGNYDANITWSEVIANYGLLHDNTSRMRLKWHGDIENLEEDIIGTICSTSDPSLLIFNVDRDTLPVNTIPSVNRIIDQSVARPGFNGLPSAQVGQRYLCGGDDTDATSVWGINIGTNDIIEYNGSAWVTSFDSSAYEGTAYVTNIYTLQQLKFVDKEWQDTFQGIYESGYWRLELLEE
jgi:hypothetical protein